MGSSAASPGSLSSLVDQSSSSESLDSSGMASAARTSGVDCSPASLRQNFRMWKKQSVGSAAASKRLYRSGGGVARPRATSAAPRA